MSHERLHEAIKTQADELKKRVEWLQKMYEKQTHTIHLAQASADQILTEIQAKTLALEGLRAEWKKVSNGHSNNGSKE
jgi:hypothetical protein